MKADLHVHSHFSDGSDSVELVMQKAKQESVTHISFVDHDTVESLQVAKTLGRAYGIEVIPGIEISAYDFKRNRKVHILGYHYDEQAPNINELCQAVLSRRHHHSLQQIEQIKAHGLDLDIADITSLAKPSDTIYKQHIMKHLTEAAYASEEYQTLYRSLFKGQGPAAGDIIYADVFDAIRAIKNDGGLAVVAHPGQLDSYDLIPELLVVGLDGIERDHPDHSEQDYEKVDILAEVYGFFTTGGSDYHGAFGTPITIGSHSTQLSKNSYLY